MASYVRSVFYPVFRRELVGVAKTHNYEEFTSKETGDLEVTVDKLSGYEVLEKPKRLDRWLDFLTRASGSEPVFFFILALLVGWALTGIKCSRAITWQEAISDVQAIMSYVFDSFLMRQQLNAYERTLIATAQVSSRSQSLLRMGTQYVKAVPRGRLKRMVEQAKCREMTSFDLQLPKETLFGRLVTKAAIVFGHITTVVIYWVAIVIWLAFGPKNSWSNQWQLDINSATSALMMLVFSFLANIRERHSEYITTCLDSIFHADAMLEVRLRIATVDDIDNKPVVVPPPQISYVQKLIFYYADVVGTLLGIVVLIAVLFIWIAIGPVMKFSDNWWLTIGTYSGLVGLNDGFVLRNVQARMGEYEDRCFDRVDEDDEKLFQLFGLGTVAHRHLDQSSITHRVSNFMTKVCGHQLTVIIGLVLVITLVIISSAMKWNTTGQLISNVPPSIIESFFMIILITGHNSSDAQKRLDLEQLYERRLLLLKLAETMEEAGQLSGAKNGTKRHAKDITDVLGDPHCGVTLLKSAKLAPARAV